MVLIDCGLGCGVEPGDYVIKLFVSIPLDEGGALLEITKSFRDVKNVSQEWKTSPFSAYRAGRGATYDIITFNVNARVCEGIISLARSHLICVSTDLVGIL